MQETTSHDRLRQEIFSATSVGELQRLMDDRLDQLSKEDKETILVRRRELSQPEVQGINRHERRKAAALARRVR